MYKRTVYIIIILVFAYTYNILSQNLVIDGGFEDVSLYIDDNNTELYRYNKWISLTSIKQKTKNGAPYFPKFLKRKSSTDKKIISYYSPYEGNSYLTCIIPSLRNLYQSKLVKPVKKDKVYRISFMLKILSDYYKKNKVEKAVKNGEIGILLTTSSQNDSIRRKLLMNPKIKINPTVKVDNYSYSCEEQWISFSETWRADKDYNYVVVGNFEPLLQGKEIGYRTIKGVTYRIDNLKFEKLSDNETFILGKEIITDCRDVKDEKLNTNKKFKITLLDNVQNTHHDSILDKYYQKIYKAENMVIAKEYPKAIELYFSAFQYKKPYFTDYFNLKNILKLDRNSNRIFLDSLKSLNFSFRSKNKSLSNQIDSLFRMDQSCRFNNGSITVQDSTNYVFVKKLYNTGKILSENTIGHNSMNKLHVILLHLSRYNRFRSLLNYLFNAVLRGDIKNRDFVFLMDSYVKNNNRSDNKQSYYCTDCAIPIYSKFVVPIIDTISLNKYNIRRKTIYLESLDEQYKKQYYNFKNGYELANFYEIISMFPTDKSIPESQKRKFLKQENILIEELKEKYREFTNY